MTLIFNPKDPCHYIGLVISIFLIILLLIFISIVLLALVTLLVSLGIYIGGATTANSLLQSIGEYMAMAGFLLLVPCLILVGVIIARAT